MGGGFTRMGGPPAGGKGRQESFQFLVKKIDPVFANSLSDMQINIY